MAITVMSCRNYCPGDSDAREYPEGCYAPLGYNTPGDIADRKNRGFGDLGVYVKTFAEGCVVGVREMNGYDDSDFYATFYDPASDSFKEIMYATTRGWTYAAGAFVDARPEIMALYAARCAAAVASARAAAIEREKLVPRKGKRAKIAAGMTKRAKAFPHIGKSGEIVWIGEKRSRYGTWSLGWRVGIRPDGEREAAFMDIGYVIMIDEAGTEIGKATAPNPMLEGVLASHAAARGAVTA